jgi:hypothetical protein
MNMLQTTAKTAPQTTLNSNSKKKEKFPIIKVTNTVNIIDAKRFTLQDWQDLEQDLVNEFSKFGNIIQSFIVKPFMA